MPELTSEEKSLLSRLIDKEIIEIKPKIEREGVTYQGLDFILEEYGRQGFMLLMKSLAFKGILTVKPYLPAIFCPKCDSTYLNSNYACPRCESIHLNRAVLLEHIFCGYQGYKEDFISGSFLKCPHCETDLGSILSKPPGDKTKNDYKIVGSTFKCKKCENTISRPNVIHVCQNCGEKFDFRTAGYEEILGYEIPEQIIRIMRRSDKINVLLVEDNSTEAQILTRLLLKSEKEMQVEHLVSGREAIEIIKQRFFDIIILDVGLPEMNGVQVLKEIKKINITTPVIMLTGMDDRKTAVEALKLGAVDYIVKSKTAYKELPSIIERMIKE